MNVHGNPGKGPKVPPQAGKNILNESCILSFTEIILKIFESEPYSTRLKQQTLHFKTF